MYNEFGTLSESEWNKKLSLLKATITMNVYLNVKRTCNVNMSVQQKGSKYQTESIMK